MLYEPGHGCLALLGVWLKHDRLADGLSELLSEKGIKGFEGQALCLPVQCQDSVDVWTGPWYLDCGGHEVKGRDG